MTVFEKDSEYIANTYARFPVEIVSGRGALLKGADGKEYIDLTSGIGVNIFGMCDPEWTEAVIAQMRRFQHTSNLYYTEPCVTLAEELCRRTGFKKVFFSNSGAEANECAIKAARLYGAKTGRYKIITVRDSFHGRTITTLAATAQDSFHRDFAPLTEGFLYVPANDVGAFCEIVEENDPVAVLFETIRGEGGVLPLDTDFIDKIVDISEKRDMLVMVDEVQTGNGRTGALYSYMRYGFVPDVVTTAKGLGGGIPIGATLFGEKTENCFTPGTHGSTFGGNPLACAGAVNILRRLDDAMLKSVREKGEFIRGKLENRSGIKEIRGMGLMLGIKTDRPAGEVINRCLENGVLCLKAKDAVRLLPPLNITFDQLNTAIDILKECIEK